MIDRLREIVAHKRDEVVKAKARGLAVYAEPSPPRGFARALADRHAQGGIALVAEIKRASPSKGVIRMDYDPPAHARAYRAGGAACLSVLTDTRFFQGSSDDLAGARAACDLPVIRKDFMIDPWQAREARAMGADAILIIVAALADGVMAEIEAAAIAAGLDVLVEVHDEAELDRALRLRSRLIGINNRDLRDFSVDVGRSERIARIVPDDVLLVAESGIAHADIPRLRDAGIGCFLVGESLMRADDIAAATRALIAA